MGRPMGDIADLHADMLWDDWGPDGWDEQEEEYEMAEIKTGIVQYKNEKDTRVGKTWNLRIEGDERYFGCYKSEPQVVVGQCVTFEFSTNGAGFHNVDMKKGIKIDETTVVASSGAAPAEAAAPSEAAVAAVAKSDGKDKKITWQSARNTAAAIMKVAAAEDALDLGAKKAGKFEALLVQFNQLTLDLYNDAMTVQTTGENPFGGDE